MLVKPKGCISFWSLESSCWGSRVPPLSSVAVAVDGTRDSGRGRTGAWVLPACSAGPEWRVQRSARRGSGAGARPGTPRRDDGSR